MDDRKQRFYQSLERKLHEPDDLDECYHHDKSTEDGGFNHKRSIRRLNANRHQEISVVRCALLKNGNFCFDYGNADPLFIHGVAKELEDVANHMDAQDWDDDDDD